MSETFGKCCATLIIKKNINVPMNRFLCDTNIMVDPLSRDVFEWNRVESSSVILARPLLDFGSDFQQTRLTKDVILCGSRHNK